MTPKRARSALLVTTEPLPALALVRAFFLLHFVVFKVFSRHVLAALLLAIALCC